MALHKLHKLLNAATLPAQQGAHLQSTAHILTLQLQSQDPHRGCTGWRGCEKGMQHNLEWGDWTDTDSAHHATWQLIMSCFVSR